MADKKISALDAIVDIAANDVLPIVDTSVATTKKISVTQIAAQAPVQSVASKTGAVTLVKGDVGLGNVDNTSDANKPISTATQTALDAKQATLVSGTNIKTINSTSILGSGDITISGSVAWGGVTGTLSNQTDLQTALDGKVDENASIVGATKTKITYDAKGLVTAGADLAAGDLPTGIDAAKIADGSVSNAEFQYIGGLTSDAQTQINGKQATITGAATTITSSDLTASKALVSDGSGKVAVSSVTSTELGYVSGVTSAIQTQVDTKTAKLITANRQTASYTLVLSDADKLVEMNVATANNLTVPLNSSVAFSVGTQILLAQYGAGQTTVVATSGVTIRSNGGKLKLNVQYSGATLIKIATDEWYLFGDIVA